MTTNASRSTLPAIVEASLTTWPAITEAVEYLTTGWVFRGHERVEWTLKTSIERQLAVPRGMREMNMLHHFENRAEHWLPSHLVPSGVDFNSIAWLGLIQHYGGPTRLLDVTKSPYVALYFALEAPGEHDRVVWAISESWCFDQCAKILSDITGTPLTGVRARTGQILDCLLYGVYASNRI